MLNQSDFSLHKWVEKGGGSACLVFTDIVASTSLLSKVGTVVYTDFRRAHQDRANQLRRKFTGILIDKTGDSLFLAFHNVIKAYAFAIGLFDNPGHNNIKIRIRLHYRKISVNSDALVVKTVHYAARVMQHGKGKEFWINESAKHSLEGESPDLAHSIKWLKSEKCDLKGFEKKQKLWRVA